MGRDKLTLVGAGCVLTVHSSWDIWAQEKKNQGGFLFCFLLLFSLSPAHFSEVNGAAKTNPL